MNRDSKNIGKVFFWIQYLALFHLLPQAAILDQIRLKMPMLLVRIFTGRILVQRQCILERETWYVNVQ